MEQVDFNKPFTDIAGNNGYSFGDNSLNGGQVGQPTPLNSSANSNSPTTSTQQFQQQQVQRQPAIGTQTLPQQTQSTLPQQTTIPQQQQIPEVQQQAHLQDAAVINQAVQEIPQQQNTQEKPAQEAITDFTPPENNNVADTIDAEDTWKIIYEKLRMNISPRDLNIWYKDVYLEKIENGVAQLSCDNPMKRDWIENNHRAFLRNKLEEVIGYKPDILINIRSGVKETSTQQQSGVNYEYFDPTSYNQGNQQDQGNLFSQQPTTPGDYKFSTSTPTSGQSQQEQAQQTPALQIKAGQTQLPNSGYDSNLNPKYTVSNFVVGANNQLAYAVAEGIINSPGTVYNPVFFYGPSGVGKTHLMQAIGNAMKTRNPMTHIIYVPIETFMNELIEGIRTSKNEEFRQKYRAADLLIIDDIQFVSTYKKTQEELFNTFNALYQDNKQIIIASDRPPKEIENLPDRLRTRFEGGMVVDIQSPDYETRIAILREKLAEHNVEIAENLVTFVAQNIENNVRELEGAITKIITQQKFSPKPLTEEDVAKMLQVDLATKRRRIKPEDIINSVCEVFDVTTKDIKGQRRTAHIALSRQLIMFLLREELEYPLEKVASQVNRKDHTTVLHACEKITGLMEDDSRFKEKVERCQNLYKA